MAQLRKRREQGVSRLIGGQKKQAVKGEGVAKGEEADKKKPVLVLD
jgi:hypothetical protein